LLVKILVGEQAVERSVMRIYRDGVHPLSWYLKGADRVADPP